MGVGLYDGLELVDVQQFAAVVAGLCEAVGVQDQDIPVMEPELPVLGGAGDIRLQVQVDPAGFDLLDMINPGVRPWPDTSPMPNHKYPDRS